MGAGDENDQKTDDAFAALFAAAEECVDRIAEKRKAPELERADELMGSSERPADVEEHRPAPAATPVPPASSPRPSRTTADSAITLSLIKARDELGHLLAQEKKKVAELTVENEKLARRTERLKGEKETRKERTARELETALESARDKMLKEFLPILDNLERALEVDLGDIPDEFEKRVLGLKGGVDGVAQLFRASLNKFGVEGFDSLGAQFDPNLHEAIRRVEDPSVPSNQVVEVYHRGYRQGDRLIRPALVVVATGGPAEST